MFVSISIFHFQIYWYHLMRIPSNVLNWYWTELILAPSLKNSSLSWRYYYLIASARPLTHFWSLQILLVLASFSDWIKISLSIFFPWRNAVLTSADFKCHLLEFSNDKADWIPILLQHGESVRKSWISWNPLAHNLALVIGFPSTNLFDMTYCVETWLIIILYFSIDALAFPVF